MIGRLRAAIKILAALALLAVTVLVLGSRAHLSGVVVDEGLPVPGAKVIVSIWDFGIFDSSPHRCTAFTDASGRFRLSKGVGFLILRIDLEALSKEGRYARKRVRGGRHRLELRELGPEEKTFPGRFAYSTFSGRWMGGEDLDCQEWERLDVRR